MKKFLKLACVALRAAGRAGCQKGGASASTDTGKGNDSGTGGTTSNNVSVKILNFKPELAEKWGNIQAAVKKDLGFDLVVETAASGQYETKLRQLISTDGAPDIFQISGPVGYSNWSDYIADLDGSDVYNALSDQSLACKIDGKVKAIPVTEEGYGIIYNKSITDAYFALTNKASTGVSKREDIKSYNQLKAVVEDRQAHKSELGIDGVFAPSGLDGSTSWRITGHAFNRALVGELGSSATSTPDELQFSSNQNYRNLIDLYVKNSTRTGTQMVASNWEAEGSAFANKKVAMVQNGQWATADLTAGGKVAGTDLRRLPLYCGINNDNIKESSQGLCIGTEAYWCVNKKSSAAKQENALKFLNYLFNGNGKKYVVRDLAFNAPFKGFNSDEFAPSDPLVKEVVSWMNKDGINSVAWDFPLVPSTDNQRADLVTSLTAYYNDNFSEAKWAELVTNTKNKWKQLAEEAKQD